MNAEQPLREEMVRYGRLLHEKGFVAACDGNLTARLGPDRLLTTPTGMSKGMMEPDDLVVVDMQGRRIEGRRAPSSEIGMHLLIYRLRPDVSGIVHAHPATATGYAAAGLSLEQALVSEVVQSLGSIPLARYGTPGTEELGRTLEPLIPQHDAILMANHGVVTYGNSLLQAYMKMETVEHFARIALVTDLLGQKQPLSPRDVEKLVAGRVRNGVQSKPDGK
jgi:L-fuculose-phosphate aldolase